MYGVCACVCVYGTYIIGNIWSLISTTAPLILHIIGLQKQI